VRVRECALIDCLHEAGMPWAPQRAIRRRILVIVTFHVGILDGHDPVGGASINLEPLRMDTIPLQASGRCAPVRGRDRL
jgi:hypothetical protein